VPQPRIIKQFFDLVVGSPAVDHRPRALKHPQEWVLGARDSRPTFSATNTTGECCLDGLGKRTIAFHIAMSRKVFLFAVGGLKFWLPEDVAKNPAACFDYYFIYDKNL